MVVFPNCKINLGLNILQKRKDGYHDLETVFYPVPIKDALEIINNQTTDETIQLSQSGLHIEGDAANNLCIKAYGLLKKDFPHLPNIQMHLHKAIPMGAGLGGGSADGAFTLRLLNDKFNLNISQPQLITYSLQLGSDCPFFIVNKPCFASGRGEIIEEMLLDLSCYQIVVVNPGIHIGTGWAFSKIAPKYPAKPISAIIKQPIETWKDELINDFEQPVIHHYPEIGDIKETFYQQGAIYSSMSGSGSTVYGIFNKDRKLGFSFPKHYFVAVLDI